MGHRLSKIYTRTGDDGSTGLGNGKRIAKDDLRVECYGTVDELNSSLGVVIAGLEAGVMEPARTWLHALISRVQHELFDLGGELCIPGTQCMQAGMVKQLEQEMDAMNNHLPPLKNFVLPGGTPTAAQLHMARTICRRAERVLVSLAGDQQVNPLSIQYVNRLSDWLFVMARTVNRIGQHAEPLWAPAADRPVARMPE